MLYSEYLKTPVIKKALEIAGVADVPSTLLLKEDFVTDFTEHEAQIIIDQEVLHRRQYRDHLKKINDLEEKMKPFQKLDAKANFIKPFIEKLIAGNLAKPYDTLEKGLIRGLSETAAQWYDFDENDEVKQEDYSGLSELQKLLKESSITRLSSKMSPEEIALRVFHGGPYASWVK